MAFSLIAHAAGFGNPAAVTSAVNTTGANLIVVTGGGDGTTLVDSFGNTYTDIFGGVIDGFATGVMRYCLNPTVGAVHTCTMSSGRESLCMTAWSGAAAASVLDVNTSTATTSATGSFATGNLTPSVPGCLFIAGAVDILSAGAPLTINFGTIANVADTVGNFANSAMAYEVQTTATARNFTWAWSGASGVRLSVMAAAFKPGAGSSRGLFLPPSLSGLGGGGSFFSDRLASA